MKVTNVIRRLTRQGSRNPGAKSNARDEGKQSLGPTASKPDIDARKLRSRRQSSPRSKPSAMLKDSAAKPTPPFLGSVRPRRNSASRSLVHSMIRPAKYAQAEATYKKVLEVEAAAKKPDPQTQGAANSGLGELYARTGKVPERRLPMMQPPRSIHHRLASTSKNEAIIFFQTGNADAQVAAADAAIKIDPKNPLPYYLKARVSSRRPPSTPNRKV